MKSFLGISLFLALAQAGLPLPTLEVRPSTSNVSIGERFQVTLEARGASTTTFEFPREINTGSVELTQSRPLSAMASTAVYDAQVFALGSEARIPEIEVHYKLSDGSTGSVKSPPFALNVISTLDPSDENPAPADFAPPVPVLVSRAFWISSGSAPQAMDSLTMCSRSATCIKPTSSHSFRNASTTLAAGPISGP